MTRINVIPAKELSDQHLIAEYRELPRVLKQDVNISDAPLAYCLGRGHVKWAKRHDVFVFNRYSEILTEMVYRGFSIRKYETSLISYNENYEPSKIDIAINRQRIREKYNMKPDWYRWTNRQKPNWL